MQTSGWAGREVSAGLLLGTSAPGRERGGLQSKSKVDSHRRPSRVHRRGEGTFSPSPCSLHPYSYRRQTHPERRRCPLMCRTPHVQEFSAVTADPVQGLANPENLAQMTSCRHNPGHKASLSLQFPNLRRPSGTHSHADEWGAHLGDTAAPVVRPLFTQRLCHVRCIPAWTPL